MEQLQTRTTSDNTSPPSGGLGGGGSEYKVLPVRINKEMRKKMEALRLKTRKNLSQQVRQAVKMYLNLPENKEKIEDEG